MTIIEDAATLAAPSAAFEATLAAAPGSMGSPTQALTRSTARTTVLPTFTASAMLLTDRVRYEMGAQLGEGGMGEVALAFDHDIGRSVAVKLLRKDLAGDSSSLARFVDEIKTVGSLEHPNIVPIHDVGVDERGRYFFVMKRVEGDTLEAIIERLAAGDPQTHAQYTFTRRVELMIALLRALEYAHAQGVVHRDIKPANVMIGKYGEVVLMDWGVAKPVDAPERPAPGPAESPTGNDSLRARMFTTRSGALVGTPAYMSPEQARGENLSIDQRSDLYSACVLFNELLSLQHYLHGQTTLEGVLTTISTKDVDVLAAPTHPAQGIVPAELLHILRRGLQRDPAQRYQNAGEFIHRLAMALDGTFPVQCPVTFTKRAMRGVERRLDRNPGLVLAAIGLSLVAIVTVTVVAVRSLV